MFFIRGFIIKGGDYMCMHASMHPCIHASMRAYVYTHIHTYSHTYTDARMHGRPSGALHRRHPEPRRALGAPRRPDPPPLRPPRRGLREGGDQRGGGSQGGRLSPGCLVSGFCLKFDVLLFRVMIRSHVYISGNYGFFRNPPHV